MPDSKITPGPWETDALGDVVGRYGGKVCRVILSDIDPRGRANAKAVAALPDMVEALKSWKCGACGGSGRYKDKGFRGEEFRTEEVVCKRCNGGGLDPAASAALEKAGLA